MKNNLSQYTASSMPLSFLWMIPLIKRSARSLHITWFDFSALSRQVVWKSSSTAGFAPFVSNNMAASWNPTENNKTILKFNKTFSSFTLPNNDIKTDTDIDQICTERNGYLHQSLSEQYEHLHTILNKPFLLVSVLMSASVNTPWMRKPGFSH